MDFSKQIKSRLIAFTNQIIFSKEILYNSVITDSSLRIYSYLCSEFDSGFLKERQELLKLLISNSLKSQTLFSGFIILVSLSYLLLCETTCDYFLMFEGSEIIFKLIQSLYEHPQIVYYGLLNIYLLSFQSKFIGYIYSNKNFVFKIIINVIKFHKKEKINRIFCKFLKNLLAKIPNLNLNDIDFNIETYLKRINYNTKDKELQNITSVISNKIDMRKQSIYNIFRFK